MAEPAAGVGGPSPLRSRTAAHKAGGEGALWALWAAMQGEAGIGALGEVKGVGRRAQAGGQLGHHPEVLRVGSRDPGLDCFRRFAEELGQASSLSLQPTWA